MEGQGNLKKPEQIDEAAPEHDEPADIEADELFEEGEIPRSGSDKAESGLPRLELAAADERSLSEKVNSWRVEKSPERGVDRLKLISAYRVSKEDFLKANECDRLPDPGTAAIYKLRHPTTGQVDGGWQMEKVNDDGTLILRKTYQIDVRSKDDHRGVLESLPSVPPEFARQIERTLRRIPANVMDSLRRHGYKIVAAPTIPDAIPDLKELTPRGWPKDMSFYNSDGTHDDVSKRIIAPMRFKQGDEWLPVYRENVVTHQIGHALDFAHGFLSASPEFKAAYQKDMAAIADKNKPVVKYLSQPDGVGRQETFAAVFGLLLTGPENESDREFLEHSFPNVIKVVRKQIEELR